MRSVRRIILEHAVTSGIATLGLSLCILYSATNGLEHLIRPITFVLLFVLLTWPTIMTLELRRYWRGEPENPVDVITPIIGWGGLIYLFSMFV